MDNFKFEIVKIKTNIGYKGSYKFKIHNISKEIRDLFYNSVWHVCFDTKKIKKYHDMDFSKISKKRYLWNIKA